MLGKETCAKGADIIVKGLATVLLLCIYIYVYFVASLCLFLTSAVH